MFDRNGFIAEIAESEKFFFEEIVLINAYKIWLIKWVPIEIN